MSDPIDTGESALKPYSLKNQAKGDQKPLEKMEIAELLALRDEIDALLPSTTLKDINVEQEVLLQFIRVKALQTELATKQSDIPANQLAQVANTVAKTLSEIVRMRNEIYNGEQYRMMEAALAKALRSMSEEAREVFYKAYGRAAEEMADVGQQSVS